MLAHAAGAVLLAIALLVTTTTTCAQSQGKNQAQIRACGGPAITLDIATALGAPPQELACGGRSVWFRDSDAAVAKLSF